MGVGGRRQYGAILLSRQPRRPCRQDSWVTHTEQAVLCLKANGHGVVSSVGQSTWDMITSVASIHKVPIRLVIPSATRTTTADTDEFIRQFDLRSDLIEFVTSPASKRSSKTDRLVSRDREVIQHADCLLPVSIRPDGSMERLIESASADGKPVDRRFAVEYSDRRKTLQYAVDASRISQEIRHIGDDYLIHWTRTANGRWPDECTIDYYRDILSNDRYCRTGHDTLTHILTTNRLIASARHMPRGYATVAFSGLSPLEAVPLMRWRSRFGEMSFEPYGIGIKHKAALAAGIRKVSYVARRNPACVEPWLCQSTGQKTDWRQEREYRCLGDLDLTKISKTDMLALCLHSDEATELRQEFGVPVISFY